MTVPTAPTSISICPDWANGVLTSVSLLRSLFHERVLPGGFRPAPATSGDTRITCTAPDKLQPCLGPWDPGTSQRAAHVNGEIMPALRHTTPRRVGVIAQGPERAAERERTVVEPRDVEVLLAITDSMAAAIHAGSFQTDPEEGILLDLTIGRVRCLLVEQQETVSVSLSPREQQIALMVAAGRTNQAIAGSLEISAWTVSTHRGGSTPNSRSPVGPRWSRTCSVVPSTPRSSTRRRTTARVEETDRQSVPHVFETSEDCEDRPIAEPRSQWVIGSVRGRSSDSPSYTHGAMRGAATGMSTVLTARGWRPHRPCSTRRARVSSLVRPKGRSRHGATGVAPTPGDMTRIARGPRERGARARSHVPWSIASDQAHAVGDCSDLRPVDGIEFGQDV